MTLSSFTAKVAPLVRRKSGRGLRGVLLFGVRTRASAAVEFALVLPFMVILLAGVTELGKALLDHHALTKSVRDSARYLSRVKNPDSAAARLAATNIALRGEYDSVADSSLPYIISYWTNNGTLAIEIATVPNPGPDGFTYRGTDPIRIVKVTASVSAPTSAFPLLSLISGNQGIGFAAHHEQRYGGD